MTNTETIVVAVRIRPLSSQERQDNRQIVTNAIEETGVIEVVNPSASSLPDSSSKKRFTFDHVFAADSSQRKVYNTCVHPIVQSVIEGFNGTAFCFGQTGAGKSHTMLGMNDPAELRGIIPNAFVHIFDHLALDTSNDKYLIQASYFEIYNEQIKDLLTTSTDKNIAIKGNSFKGLDLKEHPETGVFIKGLTSRVVKSVEEIDAVLQTGAKNRSVGATLMNVGSSRSHAVFTVVIECCSVDDAGVEHIRVGKLNLVDLAGSERQGKTGASGDRLKEGNSINLSLSALGNVISALVDGTSKRHIPYRDSKLTRILQDSLGGNTRTVMLANAGPADYNYDETVSTLRYANRAKNIKNKPVINEDPKDAMLREYQSEISVLRKQLAAMKSASSEGVDGDSTNNHDESFVAADQSLNVSREVEEERDALRARLDDETKVRADMEQQRAALQEQLEAMEAKVMVGGEVADQAAKQEAALRKAEQELIARKETELALAREIEAKEELNMNLEENFSSLADEVSHKTRKLKKLYQKYKEAKGEIVDLQSEFQSERNDLLETIRVLQRQLRLKDLVVSNFMPSRYAQQIVDGAVWSEESEEWILPSWRENASNQFDVESTVPPSTRETTGDGYSPRILKLLETPYGRPAKNKKASRKEGKKKNKVQAVPSKTNSRPMTAI